MIIGNSNGLDIILKSKYANRHGLIAGATGTGKTVTIKMLSEKFSNLGTSVFITDIKGDLTGFIEKGELNDKLKSHLEKTKVETPIFDSFPTTFWDLNGEKGLPLRASVSEMGPLILSKMLSLNDTQKGILYALFKIADDEGLLLLDFKDLKAMLSFVSENSKELSKEYGNLDTRSIGTIQRNLLVLESQGAEKFFQEPALNIKDFIRQDQNQKGYINVLNASTIYTQPDLYSSFILWLLSELFEELEEVGDTEIPKIVFFFEEAHLLFQNASKELLEKIEQVVKLIRSKGVGIFFVTQNPRDIPDNVLAQLSNKIQHALRTYTPKEQRSINSIADSFRTDDTMNIKEEILSLEIGQALVSTLGDNAIPNIVKKAYINAPQSKIGPSDNSLVQNNIKSDNLYRIYSNTFDSVSAYEVLKKKAEETNVEVKEEDKKEDSSFFSNLFKAKGRGDSPVDRMVKSAMGSIGTQVGRTLIRGILGGFKKR